MQPVQRKVRNPANGVNFRGVDSGPFFLKALRQVVSVLFGGRANKGPK